MSDFTTILSRTEIASTTHGVNVTSKFQNIIGTQLLGNLKQVVNGTKDGSHFLRSSLNTDINGVCLPRLDAHTQSLANILIIDCDKRINEDGIALEGAPDPHKISGILRAHKIAHILYASYSHYEINKGNRYRIIIPTKKPYSRKQLAPTVETVISLINTNLGCELLANAKENSVWSQPWYYPRKSTNSSVETLYFEYLDGKALEITEPFELPPTTKSVAKKPPTKDGELSPITSFNEQYSLTDLLMQYGYKKIYSSKEYQKWLSPSSTSLIAGITVKDNKFFSHHNDEFNDGYWHDAFDFMRTKEGLTQKDAVKKAAQNTLASDGRTIDEYNKSLAKRGSYVSNRTNQPIPHTEILHQLIMKITLINFRKAANITNEKEKLKSNHFHVIVIRTILDLAKKHNWGICRNHDFIYLYNGAYWCLIDTEKLKAFLGEAAEKMGVDEFTAQHFNFRKQLLEQFITLAHLPKPEQPKDVVFVNLKNGTFEITPSGTHLKPFNRDDFITYQLPFEYDESAVAPIFQKYLDRVLPDKELQYILSEYLGYVFIHPSTLKLEKTLLLYGKGANGKSVFYEIVRSLFGEQNTSEYSLQSLTNENGYYRAMIANKLVNYASEINGRLEASIFKQLVSGEPVEARLPYGNPFTLSKYAKLIFNCNELPKDTEQTEAFFRRFLIIPFNITIPEHEQDKQIAKKIIDAELSGIFNWVLDGLKRLLNQKQFTDNETVRQMREQYEKESDSVKLFTEETGYKPNSDCYVAIKILYPQYRAFCMEDGLRPVSKKNFIDRLANQRILIEKKNIGKVAFVTRLLNH